MRVHVLALVRSVVIQEEGLPVGFDLDAGLSCSLLKVALPDVTPGSDGVADQSHI